MRRQEYRDQKALQWLHHVRNEELKAAIHFFPSDKGIRILEIGGGEGYVAKCISDMGYDVTSIDIAPIFPQLYPVLEVDTSRLNFRSETFDVIFSSQVLAHIKNIELAYQEIRRVLKKSGIMIHIVPTTWWTLLTNFWHYCLMPKYVPAYIIKKRLFRCNKKQTPNKEESITSKNNTAGIPRSRIINYLLLHPLGANPSFVHEIYYFSSFYWKRSFQKHGFRIISVKNGPYLYSGYGVFKMRFLKLRKFLAKHFLSTSYCFVLKR